MKPLSPSQLEALRARLVAAGLAEWERLYTEGVHATPEQTIGALVDVMLLELAAELRELA